MFVCLVASDIKESLTTRFPSRISIFARGRKNIHEGLNEMQSRFLLFLVTVAEGVAVLDANQAFGADGIP